MSWLSNLETTPGGVGWRRQLLRALVLVTIPSVASVVFNLVRSDGLPLIALGDYTDAILVPCPENPIEAEPVHVDGLPMGTGDVVYVDARSPGEFLAWHIIGAISIPHRALQTDDYEAEIDRDLEPLSAFRAMPIVVCGDEQLGSGRSLAAVLREHGFADVRYLVGGCDSWLQADRPVERTNDGAAALGVDDIPADLEGLFVVDARFSRYYRRGRLPGAVCVSYTMVSGPEDTRLDPIRNTVDQRVLVYGSASRGEGESLARLLAANGWHDVSFLTGGFEAWRDAGRPIESDSASSDATPAEGSGTTAGEGRTE